MGIKNGISFLIHYNLFAFINRNIYENQMLNFSSTLKACHKYSEYLIRSASVLNKPTLYQLFCNFNIQINEMGI